MSIKSSKFNWKIFIFGLLLGAFIFAGLSYLFGGLIRSPLARQSTKPSAQISQPVSFKIGPYNHILGNYNAPVTLVVFNDFTCRYCQDYALTLEKLVKERPQEVRIVWKHFPLNQQYLLADVASECADEQGKFWEYASQLYRHTQPFTQDFYLQTAQKIGLDQAKFKECISSDKYNAKIKADYYEGLMKGVIGAPATFINGNYQAGALPLAQLLQAVDQLAPAK